MDAHFLKQISNIPTRYKDAKLHPLTNEQEKLIKALKENWNIARSLDDVRDVVVYGSIGTGKTYIMIALLNALIEKGVHCKYTTEFEILEQYARKNYKEFDKYETAKILLIDEVGKRQLAEWQKIQLEELVSKRYNYCLPTFFITNLEKEEFKAQIGDRLADRLRDNKVIQFTLIGESLRGKQ